MSENRINLSTLKYDILNHCENCIDFNKCIESKCLVGYALMCIDYSEKTGKTQISGGHKMIPDQDSKSYAVDFVADGLAQTCLECKNCMDNHTNDCVIAISRHCLEKSRIKKTIFYKGNVITYLFDLANVDKDLAERTRDAYQLKR